MKRQPHPKLFADKVIDHKEALFVVKCNVAELRRWNSEQCLFTPNNNNNNNNNSSNNNNNNNNNNNMYDATLTCPNDG